MRVGLCYDLRDDHRAEGLSEDEVAEFDRADTIDALEGALRSRGLETVRIGNVRQLMTALLRGERWDLVFNIAECRYGLAREALVPALLEEHRIPCTFSDALVCALTLHKGMTKHVLRDHGIETPDFHVIERLEQLERIALPYPLFAKPVAEGTSKGVSPASRARDARELREVCADLLQRFHQPVLVETYLPGREFTIGILGTGERARALGALEVCLLANAEPDIYTYVNKEDCERRIDYRLARDEEARRATVLALETWKVLGVRDGGRVDVRLDALGRPHVLEINPLPGLHPEHSDLPILATRIDLSYAGLIGAIVDSALERSSSLGAEALEPCGSSC
ncbi:MAG: ATP-grasp domain-containing protein [Planctomycetes bacterium]|nr:ATP-grasp domain-containing protein [Planctomycetota bacterium]